MAKGARAKGKKKNRNILREKVFGPVENARIDRLSAKLYELVSMPKPEASDRMMVDKDSNLPSRSGVEADQAMEEDHDVVEVMEIDDEGKVTKKPRRASIGNRIRNLHKARKAHGPKKRKGSSTTFSIQKKGSRRMPAGKGGKK